MKHQMKQKLTGLILASLLALTPVSSSFAQTSTGTGTGSSATESGTGTGTGGPATESGTGTGTGSSESRLGDGNGGFVSDFTNKFFDSNFDEVMKLSWNVGDFRSKVERASYEKYLEEQQAENDLFTLKQNIDYKSKIAEFQQSLKANPENKSLYVELSLTYLASGDLENAEEIAKQLAAKAPESYLSLTLQAEMAEKHGKSNEKQLYLQKAVEKNPTSAVAQFKLGEELAEADKYNEAIAHLTIAAALNPKDAKVFEELNKAFAKTKDPELKTFVNGIVPKFDVKPFIEKGRTLVPVRAISEALGANVGWDGAKQQVSIQRGNTMIQLTIGSNVAIVNGQEITIDVPANIVNDRTVLPLRFVSESLGTKVDWKGESQMIVVSE